MGLSSIEKQAVRALTVEAKRSGITKAPWGNAAALDALDLDALTEQAVVIGAPITKVQKALEKPMKPGRESLSVVRYKNGKIEEVNDRLVGVLEAADEEAPEKPAVKEEKPRAVVTVAQPTQGCPAPDFDAVEIRANRVLRAFLTPEQLRDFDTTNSFVVRGADTGHLYQVTSRNARTRLDIHRRSLFDLTENMPYCVHDWTVPAAEEMLGLALFAQTPGRESYLRYISELEHG